MYAIKIKFSSLQTIINDVFRNYKVLILSYRKNALRYEIFNASKVPYKNNRGKFVCVKVTSYQHFLDQRCIKKKQISTYVCSFDERKTNRTFVLIVLVVVTIVLRC